MSRQRGSTVLLDRLAKDVHWARRGLSVREAAEIVGCSAATISRVENGYAPDLETFAKLCRWMSADPCVYLGGLRRRGAQS